MKKVFVLLCLLLVSQSALAGYSLSLYTGKSFNQSLETKNALAIELKDSNHLAFSIDRTIDSARYGFYFSNTESDFQSSPDKNVEMQYFMFQSAVEVPLSNHINSYVGAQIGANYISPNFTSSDTFFASGLYGGLEYLFSDQARILFETRWLATIVNNASNVSCALPTDENKQCLWHFDGDVLNQFQTSLGFTYRF
ncbi:outer membrane beta-barrel protein [Pseudoalteromonas sp. SR45-6]|uniref:outer membrane beta-barrel protein n=1 Tax=Pseudoalteromonas sp. SR45-6 TaxID=2760927 RepID=UPI001602B700|nr:outer membrane beta-barrel protein [Pseudoalteromonas sp. SR45-6]MBB1341702.1 outer membrane beta-barrel protein [Pseudoalteromonas sp. SR45-6]